jgi:hypothetical protein
MNNEELKEIFYQYIQFIIFYHYQKNIPITQHRLKLILQGSLNLNPILCPQKTIKNIIDKTKIGSSLPNKTYSFYDNPIPYQPLIKINPKYCLFNYLFLYNINCLFPYFPQLIAGYVEKVNQQNHEFLYLYHNQNINAAMLDRLLFKLKHKIQKEIKNKNITDLIAILISDYFLYFNTYPNTTLYLQQKTYPDPRNFKTIIDKAIQKKIITQQQDNYIRLSNNVLEMIKSITPPLLYLVNYVNYVHKAKYNRINPQYFPYLLPNLN